MITCAVKGLPSALRVQLFKFMYRDILDGSVFFSGLPDDFIARMCSELVTVTLPRNTVLVREGDIGRQMFLVVRGSLRVTDSGSDL